MARLGDVQVLVQVGEEGTNDEVHVEICSDVDNSCCDSTFDSMANDFKREQYIVTLLDCAL